MKAVKKMLCLGLIIIFFLQANYLAVYYSLYLLNNEELTSSCCEKKVINCNAHCYLDKKMNDQESKTSEGISSDIKLKIKEFIVTDYIPELKSENLKIFYSSKNFSEMKDPYSEIDHPPQL